MKKTKRRCAKKDFTKFSKRNTHKRRSQAERKRDLVRDFCPQGSSDRFDGIGDFGKERKDRRGQGVFLGTVGGGYGFVRTEDYGEDIFIPEDKTGGAIDGDLVEIVFREYINYAGNCKTEGRVTRISEFGRRDLIGTLVRQDRQHGRERGLFILPDDPKIPLRPLVTDTAGARVGEKVMVRLKRGEKNRYLTAFVTDIFGDAESKEANYEAILAECGIITEFTDEELSDAQRVSKLPISDEGRVRRDGEIIFTIDGDGAKDLDDAVSVRRTRGGYSLGVHIADVSHYVTERTSLERAAMQRGTSVYFTDKVVPMLPPVISNGVCSLNAGEDKYTLSATISISHEGELKGVKIEPSIIRSRVRGVYSEVNRIFDGSADAEILKKYREVLPALTRMRELYEILAKKSVQRGAIDMDIAEAEIILGEDGAPIDIVRTERGVAERMIEQFMLAANEAVATFLTEHNIPCVYRIHDRPSPDKLPGFISYARGLGLDVSRISSDKPTSRDFSLLLAEAEEKGLLPQVSRTMLRSMAKAKYSEYRHLHFGLGINTYCHFTSPIRRLSDLATHRIIHRVLIEGRGSLPYLSYAKRAAAAATEGEMRAINAERRIESLYKTLYMSQHIGEEFLARVSSVSGFGMFCELENTCEGLIPMSEMPGEFFFDEVNMSCRSRTEVWRLGDTVRVRVEEADIVRGKIRFSLVREDEDEIRT